MKRKQKIEGEPIAAQDDRNVMPEDFTGLLIRMGSQIEMNSEQIDRNSQILNAQKQKKRQDG